MKTKIFTIDGKLGKDIELPKIFSTKIRQDIISKVLETKKIFQPYGPSAVAGKQHAASGKIVHRRHVWRSGYGRGMSRVPRKILLRRGSQFNWQAAEISSARGGRRAHPPKPISRINVAKINKKELNLAFYSAISSTANKKEVLKKYSGINENDLKNLPIIVESKMTNLKTKNFLESLEKILGKNLMRIAIKKRCIRSGKGKLRGRRYKITAGALFVLSKSEKMKNNRIETKTASNLSVKDVSKGGIGRLVIYTEKAIKEIGEKFK